MVSYSARTTIFFLARPNAKIFYRKSFPLGQVNRVLLSMLKALLHRTIFARANHTEFDVLFNFFFLLYLLHHRVRSVLMLFALAPPHQSVIINVQALNDVDADDEEKQFR